MWRRLLSWLLGGWQHLLYVGVTERTAVARWAEHAKGKSWAPDVACWERDPRVFRSEVDVLAAERVAIVGERPVHNVAHNGNNRRAVTRRRRHLPRHVVRVRLRWAGRVFLVVCLFVGFWLAALTQGVWPGWDGPRNSVVGAVVVVALLVVARATKVRRRRRR